MRGEKTIKFDFPIRFPENGTWGESDFITVRAPGLGKFDVYNTMRAYVGKAVVNITKINDGRKKDDDITPDDDEAVTPAKDDKDEQDVMMIMSMGLDVETFPKFAHYVQKVLTNAPKLATIGENRVAITDEAWLSIEDQGGMEAISKVMSEFTGFFFDALGSPKKNGSAKPTGSVMPIRDISPTSGAKNSRSKN